MDSNGKYHPKGEGNKAVACVHFSFRQDFLSLSLHLFLVISLFSSKIYKTQALHFIRSFTYSLSLPTLSTSSRSLHLRMHLFIGFVYIVAVKINGWNVLCVTFISIIIFVTMKHCVTVRHIKWHRQTAPFIPNSASRELLSIVFHTFQCQLVHSHFNLRLKIIPECRWIFYFACHFDCGILYVSHGFFCSI